MDKNRKKKKAPPLTIFTSIRHSTTPEPSPRKHHTTSTSTSTNRKSKKHTILMISDFFFPRLGGVEMHIWSLSQCLISQGHKVVILTRQYDDRRGIRWMTNGLTVTFTDESVEGDASIDYWSWNFGDGNAAAYHNPTYTYDESGTYTVQLYVQDTNGLSNSVSQIVTVEESAGSSEISYIPTAFDLHQNYPNPFNPKTKISFDVPKIFKISIEIFNIYGQKIQTLLNNEIQPGLHSLVWDGRDKNGKELSSGIYLCRMRSESFFKSQKLILLK